MAAVKSAANTRKERRVSVRGIAQHLAQAIQQLRGAGPASRVGHEGDGGVLMGRRVGFLGEQMCGESLRIGERLAERGSQPASIAASSAPAIHETTCSIAQPCGQNTTQRGGGDDGIHRIEVAAPVIVPVHKDAGPGVNGVHKRERIGNLGVDGRYDANEGGEKRRAVSSILPALMQFTGGLQRLKPCHVRNPFGDQYEFVHERGRQASVAMRRASAADGWSAVRAPFP